MSQLSQLMQIGFMNFGVGNAQGAVAVSFVPGQNNQQGSDQADIPPYFDYFGELYQST